LITIGKIVGALGIKGWVKVKSFTRPEENLLDHSQWFLVADANDQAAAPRQVTLIDSRWQSKGWVAKLADCDDRNAAELLRGLLIQIPRQQLPVLSEQEYYWQDLVGLAVEDVHGKRLGRVDSLMETGANDVLVVVDAITQQRCLIPYLPQQVIKKIDLGAGLMLVDWDNDY
jgi:16S rRNA processing protein RimM